MVDFATVFWFKDGLAYTFAGFVFLGLLRRVLLQLPRMIHDLEKANLLHQQVELQRKEIQSLRTALRDEDLARMLDTPARWVDDVEHCFLASLRREERTKEEEETWLFEASKLLHMAINQRQRLERLIEKYGGTDKDKK